jgi:hypothetical protein
VSFGLEEKIVRLLVLSSGKPVLIYIFVLSQLQPLSPNIHTVGIFRSNRTAETFHKRLLYVERWAEAYTVSYETGGGVWVPGYTVRCRDRVRRPTLRFLGIPS